MHITYITDPFCPWCYAFTPVFDQIKSLYPDIKATYRAGGLKVDPSAPTMDDEIQEKFKEYWETVAMETGHACNVIMGSCE